MIFVVDCTSLGLVVFVGVGLGFSPVSLGSAHKANLDETGALGLDNFYDDKTCDGIPDKEGVLVRVQVDVKVLGLRIRHGGGGK